MQDISYTVHIFKEGQAFIAYVPELDVSSCGATADEARKNIHDAMEGYLEASAEMGTLSEVLEEAGYRHEAPNAKTVNAMRAADRCGGKRLGSPEVLFRDLGI